MTTILFALSIFFLGMHIFPTTHLLSPISLRLSILNPSKLYSSILLFETRKPYEFNTIHKNDPHPKYPDSFRPRYVLLLINVRNDSLNDSIIISCTVPIDYIIGLYLHLQYIMEYRYKMFPQI